VGALTPHPRPQNKRSAKKPNILVIRGDDIGYWNISAYNRGMMGYRTPNIDRIAREGVIFTDCYAQQSCTAGRATEGETHDRQRLRLRRDHDRLQLWQPILFTETSPW
jgi:hypothetical protein